MVTPLARQIINQVMLKPEQRTMPDPGDILRHMDDIHCFDVSEVIGEANRLVEAGGLNGVQLMAEATAFLPARKTWIEWRSFADPGINQRVGFLLEEKDDYAEVRVAGCGPWGVSSTPMRFNIPLIKDGKVKIGVEVHDETPLDLINDAARAAGSLVGALAMINTPRIIGRRQHMPHRGLEKKLLKDRPNIGMFPLNAWTEIVLRVTPPRDVSNKSPSEAHLTGEKALHFCRSHLRIQHGKLVVVKGHWRGDASLGIKRSRYKVTL